MLNIRDVLLVYMFIGLKTNTVFHSAHSTYIFLHLVAYLSSCHEKAINASHFASFFELESIKSNRAFWVGFRS